MSSDRVSSCPSQATTTSHWSVEVGGSRRKDLVWSYDFPAAAVALTAGLVALSNEKVDLFLDGSPLAQPVTHVLRP